MQRNISTNATRATHELPWDDIHCVLLDMDGTVLDLNYDNHVWNELVPAAYAAARGVALDNAKADLLAHMGEIHGTIEFYSFDYWTAYTGIDLVAVHRAATDLIRYRPGALAFLDWLRESGREVILATNAHHDSIRVKNEHAFIDSKVDAVASSHDYGAPKEAAAFWEALLNEYGYAPEQSLFVDDNEPVLDAAHLSGIEHLLAVNTPDSSKPPRTELRYPSFDHFAEICTHIHT